MQLAAVCAKHIIDPNNNAAPNMDFSNELPSGLTPESLINIYNRVWELQTQSGLEMKREKPETPLSTIHSDLEGLFEQ